MMDLSNSSWMTTKGRFRHVSWKASERVKPPRPLGSEPPPKTPVQLRGHTGRLHVCSARQKAQRRPQPARHTHHTTSDAQGFRKASRAGMGPGPQGRRQPRQVPGQHSITEDQPPVRTQAPQGRRHTPPGLTLPWTRPRVATTNHFLLSWDMQHTLLKSGTGLPTESVMQSASHTSRASLRPRPRSCLTCVLTLQGPHAAEHRPPRSAGRAPTHGAGPPAPGPGNPPRGQEALRPAQS